MKTILNSYTNVKLLSILGRHVRKIMKVVICSVEGISVCDDICFNNWMPIRSKAHVSIMLVFIIQNLKRLADLMRTFGCVSVNVCLSVMKSLHLLNDLIDIKLLTIVKRMLETWWKWLAASPRAISKVTNWVHMKIPSG